jgi:hypothetical protein
MADEYMEQKIRTYKPQKKEDGSKVQKIVVGTTKKMFGFKSKGESGNRSKE